MVVMSSAMLVMCSVVAAVSSVLLLSLFLLLLLLLLSGVLQIESVVTHKRELKTQPANGVVEFQHFAYNQYNALVCTASRVMMVAKRPPSKL